MTPGLIGIASGKIGRYREFDMCVYNVYSPPESGIDLEIGDEIARNYNNMVRKMLAGKYEWLWILGDDHVFNQDLLKNLLERDVDVVVPMCVRRSPPYTPVLCADREHGYKVLDFEWVKGKSGLVELTDVTAGNAGMLIKRHVFEQMPEPWFENGKTFPHVGGCDVWFCQKLLDLGIKVYLDMDNLIGHLTHVGIWYDEGIPTVRNAGWQTFRETT